MQNKLKIKKSLWLGLVLLLLSCGLISFLLFFDTEGKSEVFLADEIQLENAVSKALLETEAGDDECSAEGHKILGYEKRGEELLVYTLTMVGGYGFENGHFIKVSGSGIIPAVLHFSLSYQFKKIIYPQDGANYTESLKQMFPAQYYSECINIQEAVYEDLKVQERSYARQYLESIGREAEIGNYSDFEHILLTDVGVPVEVSNLMISSKDISHYPYWIGNSERIEDGTRYVYELNYNTDNKQIIYKKYQYDDHTLIEQFIFDGATGEAVEFFPDKPE